MWYKIKWSIRENLSQYLTSKNRKEMARKSGQHWWNKYKYMQHILKWSCISLWCCKYNLSMVVLFTIGSAVTVTVWCITTCYLVLYGLTWIIAENAVTTGIEWKNVWGRPKSLILKCSLALIDWHTLSFAWLICFYLFLP